MRSLVEENKAWFDEVWEKLDKKLSVVAKRSFDKIPYTTKDGVHDSKVEGTAINWWTNGFWPGLMWVMYAGTEKDVYKDTAINAEKILDGAFANYDALHHDVGFMWHISAGNHYRLLGDNAARTRAMYAANVLAGRYNLKGGFIRAWNGNQVGWTIIDCMMNIPLLYWASKETNDPRFAHIAKAHADMAIRDHIRDDGSVVHIVSHDIDTGEIVETFGGQGYGVGSSWSRGQAWAIYGFALSYLHTNDIKYLDAAKKVAHYFIAACCDDYLPKCDFRSPEEPIIYDTTAGAITACGLIEIAKHVPENEKGMYLNAAVKMLKAMEEKFCNWSEDEDSIVQNGTERYTGGIHIPIIYGDYYFAEAIYMLRGGEFKFW